MNPLTPEYLAELEAAIARATKEHSLSAGVTFSYAPNPDDLDEIIKAARTFHAIAPLLMEVIEARGRATEGEWKSREDSMRPAYGTVKSYDAKATICDARNKNGKANRHFITTAANNITKIEKVLRDG